ncbi:23330_t:CDS:2 [Gigaspora rosea]|nr:23330_t:CDS:2 [Gigaspora rosea]
MFQFLFTLLPVIWRHNLQLDLLTQCVIWDKLIIGVDIGAKEAKVKLNHDIQHEKPVDVTTPEEIKYEIMHNHHMDPVQLRTHICQRFDALQVTPKQIYYWCSIFNQQFFKLDENPFTSMRRFLDNPNNNAKFCYEWNNKSDTAVGFITPLLTELLPVSSIHCNATYKTAKGQFELYGIISSVHGAGFPVAYLMLNTTNASDNAQTGLRTKALTSFLSSLCNKGLQPWHFYTDKDFAQINAAKEIWPNINIQLCLWYVEKAIKEKIKSSKKIKQTQYLPSEAVKEFKLRDEVVSLIKKHFNMHQKIPVNAARLFLTADKIHISAVHEMYEFCFRNRLVLLWAYLWSKWYKITWWTLWAQSAQTIIPIRKTNMLIESHWKVGKKREMKKGKGEVKEKKKKVECVSGRSSFSPRLDYVVWIISIRLLPDQLVRLYQMCHGCITPSWFDDFKKDWNRLATTPIDDNDHTCNNITEVDKDDKAPCPRSGNNSVEMGENDEVFDPEMRQIYEQKVEAIKRMADHLDQELAANNFNHITHVINNMDRLFTMLNDIEIAQNRRRHNRMWRESTPWTLYLQ